MSWKFNTTTIKGTVQKAETINTIKRMVRNIPINASIYLLQEMWVFEILYIIGKMWTFLLFKTPQYIVLERVC